MPFQDFTTTPIFNQPAIAYPAIGTEQTAIVIPMRVFQYIGLKRDRKLAPMGVIPSVNPKTNVATGGTFITGGTMELPKLTISGQLDTPVAAATTRSQFATPTLTYFSQRVTYADIIAGCLEGRVTNTDGSSIDPLWFRDPFGKVFTGIKVLRFDAKYVERVPGRQTFNLGLLVGNNAN